MSRHYHPFIDELLSGARRMERGFELEGRELAHILKRLTELEVEEGGPYTLGDGTQDILLNIAAACLLAAYGIRLPKLDAYIAANVEVRLPHRHRKLCEFLTRLREPKLPHARIEPAEETHMLALIKAKADERFASMPQDLRRACTILFERTIRGNPDRQMPLMAFFFREALGRKGGHFGDAHIAQLGLANVFFWAAFIVYDDFWDADEAADASLLPAANLFARHYIGQFSEVRSHEPGFREFFRAFMDKLDAANSWEIRNCRMERKGDCIVLPEKLPDFGDLECKFYPAAGHVFGPAAMLVSAGAKMNSPEFRHLIDYFKHYLIGMQLNDDLHDWKEDLERGHISTTVAPLIGIWRRQYPERKEMDLSSDMSELEELFWFHTLEPLCKKVLSHARLSRAALAKVPLIENPAPLEQFITRIERSAREAQRNYASSRALLEEFS